VLKGNGADVAQHCVPPVNGRRMSITLRRYTWTAIMHLAIVSGFVVAASLQGCHLSALQWHGHAVSHMSAWSLLKPRVRTNEHIGCPDWCTGCKMSMPGR